MRTWDAAGRNGCLRADQVQCCCSAGCTGTSRNGWLLPGGPGQPWVLDRPAEIWRIFRYLACGVLVPCDDDAATPRPTVQGHASLMSIHLHQTTTSSTRPQRNSRDHQPQNILNDQPSFCRRPTSLSMRHRSRLISARRLQGRHPAQRHAPETRQCHHRPTDRLCLFVHVEAECTVMAPGSDL